MSDFLANVISRSLAPAEAIRPRRRSRFEPAIEAQTAPGDLAPEVEVSAATVLNADGQIGLPRAAAPAPAAEDAEPNLLRGDARERQPPMYTPATDRSPASGHLAAAGEQQPPMYTPATDRSALAHLAAAAAPQRVVPTPIPTADPAESRVIAARPPGSHPKPPPGEHSPTERLAERLVVLEHLALPFAAELPPRAVEPPVAARRMAASQLVAAERVAPPAIGRLADPPQQAVPQQSGVRPEPGIAISPAISPAVPARPPAGLAQPAPPHAAPAPTIQVTIGRIEVRATPPSTKQQRARGGPEVMGLDEYLRQRSQGGNR